LRYTFINSAVKKVNNLLPSFFIGKSYKELNLETQKK